MDAGTAAAGLPLQQWRRRLSFSSVCCRPEPRALAIAMKPTTTGSRFTTFFTALGFRRGAHNGAEPSHERTRMHPPSLLSCFKLEYLSVVGPVFL